ncbi:hypothetical protein FC68_GL000195 [Companilactobacillus farciminis KCTC 3681 = DSM 20184]|nr:hypothetical protein FC68_GL000195 [Companilactobacillus farciminis KCTC 3681 = DSM 20184]
MITRMRDNILTKTGYSSMSDIPFSDDFISYFLNHMGYKYLEDTETYHTTGKVNKNYLMDRLWDGKYSTTMTNRITFSVLVKLALELNISLEDIIYGTDDSVEIAKYNYDNYENLSKINRIYLVENFKRTKKLNRIFIKLLTYNSIRELAEKVGLGRQSIANYKNLDDNSFGTLPRKREVFDNIAMILNIEPYEILEAPVNILLPENDFLEEYTDSNIQSNVSALDKSLKLNTKDYK